MYISLGCQPESLDVKYGCLRWKYIVLDKRKPLVLTLYFGVLTKDKCLFIDAKEDKNLTQAFKQKPLISLTPGSFSLTYDLQKFRFWKQ